MSELDDKLRQTLYGNSFAVETQPKDFVLHINEKGVADIIEQIKQALADAGYAKVHKCQDIPEGATILGVTYTYSLDESEATE